MITEEIYKQVATHVIFEPLMLIIKTITYYEYAKTLVWI